MQARHLSQQFCLSVRLSLADCLQAEKRNVTPCDISVPWFFLAFVVAGQELTLCEQFYVLYLCHITNDSEDIDIKRNKTSFRKCSLIAKKELFTTLCLCFCMWTIGLILSHFVLERFLQANINAWNLFWVYELKYSNVTNMLLKLHMPIFNKVIYTMSHKNSHAFSNSFTIRFIRKYCM